MKKFLAIYVGSMASSTMEKWNAMDEATRKKTGQLGMTEWMKWGEKNQKAILDEGTPLGKTKRIDKNGISDVKNLMTGYTIIEAESHEAAAKVFLNHPHFAVFPGDSVEIMECLPMPKM
ncbi:MAG: hypothetical protein AB7T49_06880 [Oligoflexales bacterium]